MKYISKYDVYNNKIEADYYNCDSLIYKAVIIYDHERNVIELDAYERDGSINKWTFKYYDFDEKNNWLKQIAFSNGEL